MPVEETTKLKIKCDNPECPGNELDSSDRTGWLFVSHEIYGQPTLSNVFCSSACAAAAALAAEDDPNAGFHPVESTTPPAPVA